MFNKYSKNVAVFANGNAVHSIRKYGEKAFLAIFRSQCKLYLMKSQN